MQDLRVRQDTVAFSAAVSACEKGLQWQWALHLLRSFACRTILFLVEFLRFLISFQNIVLLLLCVLCIFILSFAQVHAPARPRRRGHLQRRGERVREVRPVGVGAGPSGGDQGESYG